MSLVSASGIKMYSAVTVALFAFFMTPLHALPSTVFSNDVYPESHLDPTNFSAYDLGQLPLNEPRFSLAVALKMSNVTDLRTLIMEFVEDERICYSDSMRELILGKGENDRAANVWWAKRCGRRSSHYKGSSRSLPESTLIRPRRKSSNRASSQQSLAISPADQKKLNKLLRNKKVKCNPKKAVVELPNESPFTMLKPSCVYIKQCGGCCESPHLECVPTKIKTRKFKVLALEKKMDKAGALQLQNEQTLKRVSIEEHKACQCQCKEREEHCTSKQTYDADACRCQCPSHLFKSCPLGKVWDVKECDCVCSDISECTTGRFFDIDTCRCLRN